MDADTSSLIIEADSTRELPVVSASVDRSVPRHSKDCTEAYSRSCPMGQKSGGGVRKCGKAGKLRSEWPRSSVDLWVLDEPEWAGGVASASERPT